MPVSFLTRPIKTVSEMIHLCGLKLLQSSGSTPGLVLEFRKLHIIKTWYTIHSLLVGHDVLDMLVIFLLHQSIWMVIQFCWRFHKPHRNDIFVGNGFVSPNDIDLTNVDTIITTLDKVENGISRALANILGNSTLLIKKEGQIKELSLLDTLQLFLELIKSTLTTVTSTSLTTTLTLSTSTENIITS
jgi:hypothetical protein